MNRENFPVKFNWIYGVNTVIVISLIIGIKLYNSYLSKTYLSDGKLNLISALNIIGDQYYFIWFILGIMGILDLIGVIMYTINNGGKSWCWLGSILNIILLIILLIVYTNPILIALALACSVGAIIVFAANN